MLLGGDSKEVLKTLEDESVDLLCTDPPYGYSFMGKSWDKTLPDIGIFKECLRVLKAGSFAFVMSAPRSDVCARMMLLLEDAGFEIGFTPIYWTYASGFPKAMNIGKMVDKREGHWRGKAGKVTTGNGSMTGANYERTPLGDPITAAAAALNGSYGGFQPKPAVEVVIVAMKPLSEKTYVDQALKNGKGITWLDDCRVPTKDTFDIRAYHDHKDTFAMYENKRKDAREKYDVKPPDSSGRFPANLLVSDNVLNDHSRFFSLDEWSQSLPFLIVTKASKSEKNAGLEEMPFRQQGTKSKDERNFSDDFREFGDGVSSGHKNLAPQKNFHPTVKPLKLMSYLITLGSREGDIVLDPFVGSGTTCIAAKQLGRKYIGIEREQEYLDIAKARLDAVPDTLL